MPRIITRAEWGARPPKTAPTPVPLSARTATCTHHDGPIPITVRTFTEAGALMRRDQNFHMDGRDYNDIGYNYLVISAHPGFPAIDGLIFEGRGRDVVGAHALNHNTEWIGIQVAIGGVQQPSPAALASVRWLHDTFAAAVRRSLGKKVHSDGFPTECPGTILRTWVHSGMPVPSQPAPPTPRPTAITLEDDDMVILRSAGQHYISDAMTKRVITSPEAETAYLRAGVKVLALPDAEIAAIPTVTRAQ
jgi:hypothetical protein